jgi:hypothetical protein
MAKHDELIIRPCDGGILCVSLSIVFPRIRK